LQYAARRHACAGGYAYHRSPPWLRRPALRLATPAAMPVTARRLGCTGLPYNWLRRSPLAALAAPACPAPVPARRY